MMAFAPLPLTPAYAISKAAAFNMTQSLRALLAPHGVRVHAALTGPTATDMTRGFEIPKAYPASVAKSHLRRRGKRGRRHLPRPLVSVPRRQLANRPRQGLRTPVRNPHQRYPYRIMSTQPPCNPERNTTMSNQSYTTTYVVDQTPDEAFAAINNVRGWWTGDIERTTDQVGAVFTYRHEDIHYSKQRITELIPGQKITWHIVDATLTFAENPHEWIGTNITFEIAAKATTRRSPSPTTYWSPPSNATNSARTDGTSSSTARCGT